MKTKQYLLQVVLFALLAAAGGCASDSLVTRMKACGLDYLNTSRIVLHGSEADVGPGIVVEIEEHFLIQAIWDSIHQSRPDTVWYASGYRRAEFFADTDSDKPVLTILINESDACHIENEKERFRCPNLHAIVMKLLREAFEKQKHSARKAS